MTTAPIIVVLLIAFIVSMLTFDIVEEGHVGIYYRGSALMNSVVKPGVHFKFPFLTTFHQIQVTIQTDEVRNIPVTNNLPSAELQEE